MEVYYSLLINTASNSKFDKIYALKILKCGLCSWLILRIRHFVCIFLLDGVVFVADCIQFTFNRESMKRREEVKTQT